MSTPMPNLLPARRITPPGGHHFFAYYDKLQFDPTDRYVLAQRATFMDRPPGPDDVITVGYVDLEDDCRWHDLDQTSAWCWQQGCMLQWLPGPGRRVIHNVRRADGFGAVVHDLDAGTRRELPRAIYAVSPDGRAAIGGDFGRVADTRPGYGYVGHADPNADQAAPGDSGLWHIDLERGRTELIVTIEQIAGLDPVYDLSGIDKSKHWFNHILWGPDGSRLIFLHRWFTPASRETRMYTCRPDGSALCRVSDSTRADSFHASHFWWRDPKTIIVWGGYAAGGGAYLLVGDEGGPRTQLNRELLEQDGHMSYAPPGSVAADRWILSDTYPDAGTNLRQLFLYDVRDDRRIDIGSYDAGPFSFDDPELLECRCDLHPRWSRDGRRITIDSVHEGDRGIYIVDVTPVVAG